MLTPAEPETQRGSHAPRCRAGQPVLPSRVVFLHGLKSSCLLGIEEKSSDLWPNCWSERPPRSHAPGDSHTPSTRGEGQGPGDVAGAWIKKRARSQPWQATERFHLANSRPFQRELEIFFRRRSEAACSAARLFPLWRTRGQATGSHWGFSAFTCGTDGDTQGGRGTRGPSQGCQWIWADSKGPTPAWA